MSLPSHKGLATRSADGDEVRIAQTGGLERAPVWGRLLEARIWKDRPSPASGGISKRKKKSLPEIF